MTRNLKALGLGLLAVFAMGAVMASSASAVTHTLVTSTGASVDITAEGVGEAVFGVKTGSLEVKCTHETFAAKTVANGAQTITIEPTYTGCTAKPFGASPVDTNGCHFLLHGQTTTSPTTSTGTKTDMPADLTCPVGQSITITAPGCTIHVDPQTGLHGVGFDQEGSGTTADIKVTSTVDGIHYTTAGGFVCSLGGLSTTGNDSFLTGQATAKGYTPHSAHATSDHVGISFDSTP